MSLCAFPWIPLPDSPLQEFISFFLCYSYLVISPRSKLYSSPILHKRKKIVVVVKCQKNDLKQLKNCSSDCFIARTILHGANVNTHLKVELQVVLSSILFCMEAPPFGLSLSSHLSGYLHEPKLGSNDGCIYEINRINCTCPSSLPKVSNSVFVLLFSYSIVSKVECLWNPLDSFVICFC